MNRIGKRFTTNTSYNRPTARHSAIPQQEGMTSGSFDAFDVGKQKMTPKQFIKKVKLNRPELPPFETLKWVSYQHNGKQAWGENNDFNWELREKVAEILFADYALSDHALIKYMKFIEYINQYYQE